MVVVQDEDDILREAGDLIEQGRQYPFRRRGLRAAQRSGQVLADLCVDGLQSRNEVEGKRVMSLSPSSRDNRAARRPLPAIHSAATVVLPKPAGSEHDLGPKRRNKKLRGQDRHGDDYATETGSTNGRTAIGGGIECFF